jgi:hypothetical protein
MGQYSPMKKHLDRLHYAEPRKFETPGESLQHKLISFGHLQTVGDRTAGSNSRKRIRTA